MPHYQTNYAPGYKQQADILYLTHDNFENDKKDKMYKYAMVVVDLGNRHIDAEPMTNKTAIDAIDAMNVIYTRRKKILQKQSHCEKACIDKK